MTRDHDVLSDKADCSQGLPGFKCDFIWAVHNASINKNLRTIVLIFLQMFATKNRLPEMGGWLSIETTSGKAAMQTSQKGNSSLAARPCALPKNKHHFPALRHRFRPTGPGYSLP